VFCLTADQAKRFFLKSGLPMQTLGRIWLVTIKQNIHCSCIKFHCINNTVEFDTTTVNVLHYYISPEPEYLVCLCCEEKLSLRFYYGDLYIGKAACELVFGIFAN